MESINLSESIVTKTDKLNRITKRLIEICGGEEVGKFLLYLPSKYLRYELVDLDRNLTNTEYMPVIYGKVIGSYRRNKNIFYKVIDEKSKKELTVFLKQRGGQPSLKINIFYYFMGKISQKDDRQDVVMFFPQYKDSFQNYVEPVYYKMSSYEANHFRAIIKNIAHSMKKIAIFTTDKYGLNNLKYNTRDMFLAIHNLHNGEASIREQKAILKLLDYTCFFYQLAKIQNITIGTSKKEKYLLEVQLTLTDCQKNAIRSISGNLAKEEKTLNFLQGDVGSGKTLVAFIAIRKTMINGYNACFMSPTSILAYQHYESFKEFFPNVSCFLLSSGYKNKEYTMALEERLNSQVPTVFFGTHNLLYQKIKNVQFVVIDEQHKFGMEQRKILMDQYASSDVLFLSATPIPRTLFMLQNGQMDLFTLKCTPFPRNVTTKIAKDRVEVLHEVLETAKISKVLWINGAIDEADRKGVKATFAFFKQYMDNVYLLHGQLSDQEKLEVIKNFHSGILVATICVETGIDLPNVPLIVIEEAENFGLATLHQLRGRVGRKGEASQCLLITNKDSERLDILVQTNDGFQIAEIDLLQRGYGSFFQKQQWGFENFKSGKLNQKLFKIAGEITKNKQYNAEVIKEFSSFFLKITNVHY